MKKRTRGHNFAMYLVPVYLCISAQKRILSWSLFIIINSGFGIYILKLMENNENEWAKWPEEKGIRKVVDIIRFLVASKS